MTKHKGPIITLLAGLAVAAVLMALNLSVRNSGYQTDVAADSPSTTAVTTPAAKTTTAVPTTAAPAPPPADGIQITYAGNVNGDGATLAIAVKDGTAVAYLCDGRSAEAWLQGTASNGSLELTGASGARLSATFGNGVAAGTVSAAGRQFAFSLKAVAPPSGLYRAAANVRNATLVGGWIVLPNGKQVGLVKLGAKTVSAPPLDTTSRTATVDGTAVSVGTVDGSGL